MSAATEAYISRYRTSPDTNVFTGTIPRVDSPCLPKRRDLVRHMAQRANFKKLVNVEIMVSRRMRCKSRRIVAEV